MCSEIYDLANLHPLEYEHSFDSKALDSLQKAPGLESLIRLYNKHAVERFILIQYTGSNIQITHQNYPNLHALLVKVCSTISIPTLPDLYIEKKDEINAFTIGVDHPIIVLTTEAIECLTDDEMTFLLGHEVGHIKSKHAMYHQFASFFPDIVDFLGQYTLGVGKLLSSPLQFALLHWSRMSEFTADRAGLLAGQNFDAATQIMMKLTGVFDKNIEKSKIEAFIQQAKNFDDLDYDHLNKGIKFLSIATSTHPWTVMRTGELLRWTKSGEYQKVINRETLKRAYIRQDGDVHFCRNCGYRLTGTEKFCNMCGQSFTK